MRSGIGIPSCARDGARWIVLAAWVGILSACSGGGGGGGPTAGGDRTPPPRPDVSRIALAFTDGQASVTGSAGAVEASSTVRARNITTNVVVEVAAQSSGAFSLTTAAGFGDRIQLVAIDAAANESRSAELSAGLMTLGETRTVALPGGTGSLELIYATGDEEHVLVSQSSSAGGGALSTTFTTGARGQHNVRPASGAGRADPQAAFELRRRADLDRILRAHPRPPLARVSPLALQGAPAVGQLRSFWVIDELAQQFESRSAVLDFVGARTLIYVDRRIPPASFSRENAQALGARFDPAIYDRTRAAVGAETDLDGNGRVVILVTPAVNFAGVGVLGYFLGQDLLAAAVAPFSNQGEIFYMLSPDPDASFGWETPGAEELLRDILPSVLAHEFQHLIANGQRFVAGLPPRDTWLEEAFSHAVEWLNGFRATNEFRTAAFADAPEVAALLSDQLLDSERGASFLFAMYLLDELGEGVIRSSVLDRGRGEDNVEAITGRAWAELFHDWSLALALDGTSGADPRHDLDNLDPREIHGRLKDQSPELFSNDYLNAIHVTANELAGTWEQRPATPSYFRLNTREKQIVSVGVSGPADAGLSLGVARTR